MLAPVGWAFLEKFHPQLTFFLRFVSQYQEAGRHMYGTVPAAGAPSKRLWAGARAAGGGRAAVAVGLVVVAAAAVAGVVSVRAPAGPAVLLGARTSKLGYLLGKEDPAWVATGQQPLEYFQSQSRVKDTRDLEYWPDINFSTVRPDVYQERPPLEGTAAWAPGNGYGVVLQNSKDGTVFSGDPVYKHGFMAQKCASSVECQNADVCKEGKCRPAIFDGIDAVEASVKAAQAAMWPQAKSFGQQQLSAQMSVLRQINSQTAADEKMLGIKRRTKKARGARFEGLAMGGGTPVDLTFGVGRDGEPPYHLATVAESVRNGLLDPNAPETLPYTSVGGSGTSGQMAAVGYMQPLPQQAPAEKISGTVAEA